MSRPESVSSRIATSGSKQRELEDLVALALAAGEPLVQVALGERAVHAEAVHPLVEGEADLEHREVLDAGARGDRLAQELDDRDARDRLWVLEGEEQPLAGPLVGGSAATSTPREAGSAPPVSP